MIINEEGMIKAEIETVSGVEEITGVLERTIIDGVMIEATELTVGMINILGMMIGLMLNGIQAFGIAIAIRVGGNQSEEATSVDRIELTTIKML